MTITVQEHFCDAADGLRIHARIFEPQRATTALPVLCLPGLTRTTDDFTTIAHALASDAAVPRRVIAIDYRGRGLSDFDPKVENYAVPVETGDVQAVAASLGIAKAILLGTSRGGMISMVLSAMKPESVAGVILNDIGPVLEMSGLLKIKGYISNQTMPTSWDDAAAATKTLFARDFPNLTDADWMAWAHRGYHDRDGALKKTHDPQLATTFAGIDPANPSPPLWKLFDAIAGRPLMLIHGARSDLLSRQSVDEMLKRRPDIDLVTVDDQGHAPLLADAPTMSRIAAFCARCQL